MDYKAIIKQKFGLDDYDYGNMVYVNGLKWIKNYFGLDAIMVSTIEDVTDHLQSPLMEPLENGAFIVDGRISVAQLEKALHASFADGGAAPEVETVAGLVMHLATRVPKPGSVLKHPNGTEFLVLEASPRKVKRLKVTKAP